MITYMEIDGQAREENSQPSDVIALIERSLVAVRHDQSRRRLQFRGEAELGHGHEGARDHGQEADHGTEHGEGHEHDHARGFGHGGPFGGGAFGGPPWASGSGGSGGHGGPGARGGRRGRRDGSLGRAARFRMLDALQTASKTGSNLSISALAEAVGVDQPRASRLVQEGVERGLVRRIQDPSDARRTLIELTTAGRKLITEVRYHRRSAVEEAIASFTPEEAQTFATLFDRFVRAWPRD
jgi:DNA-binding MarR family transcriptional regulator